MRPLKLNDNINYDLKQFNNEIEKATLNQEKFSVISKYTIYYKWFLVLVKHIAIRAYKKALKIKSALF